MQNLCADMPCFRRPGHIYIYIYIYIYNIFCVGGSKRKKCYIFHKVAGGK